MKIYKSVLELIGGTPLVELGKLAETEKLYGKILAKVESFNPAGSVKDRVALEMVEEAEKETISLSPLLANLRDLVN